MIPLDKAKPIPFIRELKRGVNDKLLEDALKRLEIDATKDEDLRLWFCIQYVLPRFSVQNKIKVDRHLMTFGELLEKTKQRKILKNYWYPRHKWDLISLAGGSKKLDKNEGSLGFELITKHYKPHSKNIVFHSCSGTKPYHDSTIIRSFINLTASFDFDPFVASYCPTPLIDDEQYPFAFYQGTHWPQSYRWRPSYIVEFLKYFNYENAFFWLRPEKNEESSVYPNIREANFKKTHCYLFYEEMSDNCKNMYYYAITAKKFQQFLQPISKKFLFKKMYR